MIYIIVKNNDKSKCIICHLPLVLMLNFVNPVVYFLLKVFSIDKCYILLWLVPGSLIIAYALLDLIESLKLIRYKIICGIVMLSLILVFGIRYGDNFAWQRINNTSKLPEQTIEICKIIEEDGCDKKVIALDELCSTLRICDPEIELYYYTSNKFCCNDDKEMYVSLNKNEPYLLGIVQNAKRAGYTYVIFRQGVVDPNWASVLYNIWPVGSTDDYDVFRIAYF